MPAKNTKKKKRPILSQKKVTARRKKVSGGKLTAREVALMTAKIAAQVLIGAASGRVARNFNLNSQYVPTTSPGPRDSGSYLPINPN